MRSSAVVIAPRVRPAASASAPAVSAPARDSTLRQRRSVRLSRSRAPTASSSSSVASWNACTRSPIRRISPIFGLFDFLIISLSNHISNNREEQAVDQRALIIGGGICGPVTAMALQRAGIEAVIYEAHRPAAGGAGSYLTVATNGLDALRAIDAADPVLRAAFPTSHTVMLSGTGRRLGRVPIGSTADAATVSHTIKRADLHRVLHDEAARRGVRIEF